MQVMGAAIGAGAGHVVGEIAAYSGFIILALIGSGSFVKASVKITV
jgi:hypothetical protein